MSMMRINSDQNPNQNSTCKRDVVVPLPLLLLLSLLLLLLPLVRGIVIARHHVAQERAGLQVKVPARVGGVLAARPQQRVGVGTTGCVTYVELVRLLENGGVARMCDDIIYCSTYTHVTRNSKTTYLAAPSSSVWQSSKNARNNPPRNGASGARFCSSTNSRAPCFVSRAMKGSRGWRERESRDRCAARSGPRLPCKS